MPSNVNTLNGKCWKKNHIWEKKEIYNILGFVFIHICVGLMCIHTPAAAAAKSLQLCPTLCDPRDGSPPGSPIPGILQARILEWVAISFSNAWKRKVKVKSLSRVRFATPWTVAYQGPPSMGFARKEYWSEVPFPSPIHTPIYTYVYAYIGIYTYVYREHVHAHLKSTQIL